MSLVSWEAQRLAFMETVPNEEEKLSLLSGGGTQTQMQIVMFSTSESVNHFDLTFSLIYCAEHISYLLSLNSFPTWQFLFLLTQMCFLSLGSHEMLLSQGQRNEYFGLLCPQWLAEWRKWWGPTAGFSQLQNMGQVRMLSRTLPFAENEWKVSSNILLVKQQRLIQLTAFSKVSSDVWFLKSALERPFSVKLQS